MSERHFLTPPHTFFRDSKTIRGSDRLSAAATANTMAGRPGRGWTAEPASSVEGRRHATPQIGNSSRPCLCVAPTRRRENRPAKQDRARERRAALSNASAGPNATFREPPMSSWTRSRGLVHPSPGGRLLIRDFYPNPFLGR